MSKEYSKKDYGRLMDEFKSLHESYPKRANKEAYYSLLEMGKIRPTQATKFQSNFHIIVILAIAVMNLVTSFNYPEHTFFGLFGFIFFLGGYFVGTQKEEGVIIFLFSHGVTGFCIMNGYCVAQIFNNPMFSDSPTKLFLLLGLAALFFLGSLIYGTITNLSDKFRDNAMNRGITISLAAISTIIIQVLAIMIK